MKCSIIIPTLNREEVLCNTLRSVVELVQGRPDCEVVVVDQTKQHLVETTNCLRVLADYILIHHVDFANLARARNHGIRVSRGDFILFLDDDVEPSPGLIDGHLTCYADSTVWGVAGCSLNPGGKKLSRLDFSENEMQKLNSGKLYRFDLDWARDVTWATGCNMSFRREALFQVGGFDEAFYGVAIGEDAELCSRIRRAGGVIRYEPSAELVHLQNPTGGCRDARWEAELMAQRLDNSWYFWRRVGASRLRRIRELFRLCRANAINGTTLRQGTWVIRLVWCCKGLYRALRGSYRRSQLGLLPKSKQYISALTQHELD